jgi:aspartate-semialdehyde dehydrogenase
MWAARGPAIGKDTPALKDARSIADLQALDVIVTCQGGDYTNEIYPRLRAAGWQGYWIDAASTLRMRDDAVIILDPVNREVIDERVGARREGLHRRQLHGQPDADGAGRAVRARVWWSGCKRS